MAAKTFSAYRSVVALAGGVGGAKLAHGLQMALHVNCGGGRIDPAEAEECECGERPGEGEDDY